VGPPGWRLVVLRDKSPVFTAQYLLAAIVFSIFLVVTIGILAFMREKEMARFLAQSNLELEKRVRLRTAELKKSNIRLQTQIEEREKAERELKKGEAALRQSEEKYRVLFESFPLGVSITDRDGNIIEVNRLSEKLLEISPEIHTKKRLDSRDWKIIGPDGLPLGTEDFPGVRAKNEQVSISDVIVEDLLEYTRGRHAEKASGEINSWLQKLLDEFKDFPEGEVVCEIAPDIQRLSFDRDKLRRAVVNLVTNALQAVNARKDRAEAENAGYRPQVRVNARCEQDSVIIRIEDNGIGMDVETRKRAFEPLFSTRARGTGLGLAIVEKIIAEHDGTVSLESRPNEGTTVTIVLSTAEAL